MPMGASTSAVSSRVYRKSPPRSGGARRALRLDEHLGVGFVHAAVAALARLEVDDGLEEMAAPEVGPQDLVHVDLGVRDLPQEEIRHAQFAAGADQQVGIIDVRRVQVIGEE